MHKKTLNLISVCVVALIIVFSITQKNKLIGKNNSDNISVDENGNIQTKADEYQANILDTVSEQNVKNFQKFSEAFAQNDSDNLTESFSKNIFTQYIKYNDSGEIKDEDIVNASQDIMNTKTDLSDPTTVGDIRVTQSNTSNLKIYGNNLGLINKGITDGIASLGTNTKKDKISAMSNIYLAAAQLFLQVGVPESMEDSHIEIINGYRRYSEGLVKLNQQDSDPAKALLGLSEIKDATDQIVNNFDKIQKTIILNNISYDKSEPGYVFLSTPTLDTSTIQLEQ